MSQLSDCTDTTLAGASKRVVIVGGGFCGVLALANLVDQAETPCSIVLVEANGAPGAGVAYGTPERVHLLNVRTECIGAFADQPDGFYRWLQSPNGKTQAERFAPGVVLTRDSFAPRALYGAYLRQILAESLLKAKAKGIFVQIRQVSAIGASLVDSRTQQVMVTLECGAMQQNLLADALVLATGNPPPRRLAFEAGLGEGAGNYVVDVWRPQPYSRYPQRVSELPATAEIVLVGTGLTLIDTVLTLRAHGYQGRITAISRHGWLPAVHARTRPYPAWELTTHPERAPQSALGLFRRLRAEIEHAATLGYDWRSVIDSLRPVTPTLWRRLGFDERRKFQRHLATLWNIHRHRLAPELGAQLQAMQERGELRIVAGTIREVNPTDDGLAVSYCRRGTRQPETIDAALLLNCAGPDYELLNSGHRLLDNLCKRGLITVGPLGLGIKMTSRGTAQGRAPDAIFPLGSLLVGELLESTAVPELREQAKSVAQKVLRRLTQVERRIHVDKIVLPTQPQRPFWTRSIYLDRSTTPHFDSRIYAL